MEVLKLHVLVSFMVMLLVLVKLFLALVQQLPQLQLQPLLILLKYNFQMLLYHLHLQLQQLLALKRVINNNIKFTSPNITPSAPSYTRIFAKKHSSKISYPTVALSVSISHK